MAAASTLARWISGALQAAVRRRFSCGLRPLPARAEPPRQCPRASRCSSAPAGSSSHLNPHGAPLPRCAARARVPPHAPCSAARPRRRRGIAEAGGPGEPFLPRRSRSTRQRSRVSNRQVSRCRQVRSTCSCTGSRSRLSGHAHNVPC